MIQRKSLRVAGRFGAVFCGLAAAWAAGCATNASCKDPTRAARADTVNAWCVVEPEDTVNPDVAPVIYKDQKVGFCCKGCVPKWNSWTEAQKDAALARVLAKR